MSKAGLNIIIGATNRSNGEREANDFYATHPKAVEIFLEQAKKDGLIFNKNIWENACGMGHMSEILKSHGFDVKSTELIDRGYGETGIDFLAQTEKWGGDIITNPPFKEAERWVNHSLELINDGNYLALFLKVQFLEGKSRHKLFKRYPPKYVYINSTRQICSKNADFDRYGIGTICFCWYVWQKGYTGITEIRWIEG